MGARFTHAAASAPCAQYTVLCMLGVRNGRVHVAPGQAASPTSGAALPEHRVHSARPHCRHGRLRSARPNHSLAIGEIMLLVLQLHGVRSRGTAPPTGTNQLQAPDQARSPAFELGSCRGQHRCRLRWMHVPAAVAVAHTPATKSTSTQIVQCDNASNYVAYD